MERKSGFLTFIAALIPGVGYMYYGLVKKGAEALIIYLLISPVFNVLDMNWIGTMIKIPLWLYLFFDTFNVANRYRRGEQLQDSGFIIKDDTPISSETISSIDSRILNNKWNLVAIIFIFIGVIAVLNQVLGDNIFNIIRATIKNCIVPALLIVSGVYILIKGNKKNL
ncbi:MAG: hypothetical protein H7Y18_16135 [Clostridiaceae bacterium]|nr:hypothetical protein [Clostridiaceae bacterium]